MQLTDSEARTQISIPVESFIFLTFLILFTEMSGFLGVSKVSTKFQITIPVRVRQKYGIEVGDQIIFMEDKERIIIVRASDVQLKL